jgi:hypothetical protein
MLRTVQRKHVSLQFSDRSFPLILLVHRTTPAPDSASPQEHKSLHLFRPESMIRDVWQGFLSPPINGSALETRDTVLTYGYSCHSSSVWSMCQICEH